MAIVTRIEELNPAEGRDRELPVEGTTREYEVVLGDTTHRVSVTGGEGRYRVVVGENIFNVDARTLHGGLGRSLLVNDRSFDVEVEPHDSSRLVVTIGGQELTLEVRDHLAAQLARQAGGRKRRAGPEIIASPMPGLVVSVAVAAGDPVAAGQPVVVVEAMKMQNELAATQAGRVREVRVEPGQVVDSGQALVVIEPEA